MLRKIYFTLLVVGLMSAMSATSFAQKDKDKKDTKEILTGEAVLWREPTDITSRDLFLGSGGEEMKPDLSNVTFEKEEPSGYSVKYTVHDGAGKKWVVKLGNEARPETTANRLLWAAGYATETVYLAPCAHIKGAPKPRKDVKRCEGDGFADARFEARGEGVKRGDNWDWKSNPFAAKRELNGLLVMMALLNNWDLKTSNNVVLQVAKPDGTTELQYVISDVGATFGKTGGPISHSRNEPEKYVKTKFVEGTRGDRIKFAYSGKQGSLFDQVSVADAKWIGGLLAQLSDKQIEDAFRAGDFTPEETQMLVAEVKDRINELVNLAG
ncbi:MAG TPA: hypothetical protein VE969_08940 [Pyrinomonadaceae bacterium]|nr:hypothetical protein [Pyrinomonadaceae bacterium]